MSTMSAGDLRLSVHWWDYRQQPDWEEIAEAVDELSDGKVRLTVVENTGTQDYAIVLSDAPLTAEKAEQALERAWLGEDA